MPSDAAFAFSFIASASIFFNPLIGLLTIDCVKKLAKQEDKN